MSRNLKRNLIGMAIFTAVVFGIAFGQQSDPPACASASYAAHAAQMRGDADGAAKGNADCTEPNGDVVRTADSQEYIDQANGTTPLN